MIRSSNAKKFLRRVSQPFRCACVNWGKINANISQRNAWAFVWIDFSRTRASSSHEVVQPDLGRLHSPPIPEWPGFAVLRTLFAPSLSLSVGFGRFVLVAFTSFG